MDYENMYHQICNYKISDAKKSSKKYHQIRKYKFNDRWFLICFLVEKKN